jgi:hypothetical protein
MLSYKLAYKTRARRAVVETLETTERLGTAPR